MASKEKKSVIEQFLEGKFEEFENEAQFIHAGFDGRLPSVWIDSITVKRRFDGDFIAVLKGTRNRGKPSATYVVSFTNGTSLAECLRLVESALAFDLVKWRVDSFREDADSGPDSPEQGTELKLVSIAPKK